MWSHEANTCIVPNFRNAEPTVIGSLVTDLVLLLIMLLGLLRTRRKAGGAFRMGHFLWKQVRWCRFLLAVTNSLI
jgi:hypothetical protein